ncbi:hypothetical protein LINPERHAP1_LOCUS28567 [Linum perenne]
MKFHIIINYYLYYNFDQIKFEVLVSKHREENKIVRGGLISVYRFLFALHPRKL